MVILKGCKRRIISLQETFMDIHFVHIFWEFNSIADSLSKKKVGLSGGYHICRRKNSMKDASGYRGSYFLRCFSGDHPTSCHLPIPFLSVFVLFVVILFHF